MFACYENERGGVICDTCFYVVFCFLDDCTIYTAHGCQRTRFPVPFPPQCAKDSIFPLAREHQNTHGMGGDGNLASKNYSTWSQAMMDNLAASTHPSYFKTSHSVASKAVFYSRGTRLSTPFWARHNDMLALLSNHFCLCIM